MDYYRGFRKLDPEIDDWECEDGYSFQAFDIRHCCSSSKLFTSEQARVELIKTIKLYQDELEGFLELLGEI
jgi:hypothetical protein